MKIIKLCDIKIRDDFMQTKPNDEKIEKALEYINEYNAIDKPIILINGVLVDNYVRYLAANIKGLKEVPCVELQKMNYIIGKFDDCDKEYIWKNDKNIDIKIGDMVHVESKNPNKSNDLCVTVVGMFDCNNLALYNKHKSVIEKY